MTGTYLSTQTVTISTTTTGASIRYTTDGSAPSATVGIVYSGPVTVGSTTTINAIGYETNWTSSAVSSAVYTITGTVANPTFTPVAGTYLSTQTVTIGTTTTGASIRYTTDGSTPSATLGTLYSGPVAVTSTTTIKAIGYETAWTNSAVASAIYTITGTVANPVFSPVAGTYASTQTVAISTTTSGASIRYTTDGSTPGPTVGIVYSGPVTISSTATINAIGYETGWTSSAVTSAVYTITGTVANPTFSPAAGTYVSTQAVTISTTTAGASIRYTTDGSAPSATVGTLYSGPVNVTSSATINAIGYETAWTSSAVNTAVYTITGTGTISPGIPLSVTLNTPGQNAQLIFSGTAGQQVNVQTTNSTFSGSCYTLILSIQKPDGTQLAGTPMCGANPGDLPFETLPVTGIYTVALAPQNGSTGTVTVTLSTDQTGSLPVNTSMPLTFTIPGQNAQLTFSGTAGQQVNAQTTNSTFTGSCYSLILYIFKPDGTELAGTPMCGASPGDLPFETLPVTGIYTVALAPQNGSTGTVTVTLSVDSKGLISFIANSSSREYIRMGGRVIAIEQSTGSSVGSVLLTTTLPGQNAELAFNGAAGQTVSVQLTGSTYPGCNSVNVSLVNPGGATLASTSVCNGLGAINTQTLPVTGTYTIFVEPQNGTTGSVSVALTSP